MQLHYERYGEGHPLIILHGLFGSLENWRKLSKAFVQSFAVFAVDQRNHGRSPHSDIFNYQVVAGDLREFIQQHGLSSTHLLGHSMGGKTAMQFAVAYPDMVDKLIVVDIAPKVYPRDHDDIFDALYALDVQSLRTRQEADAALTQYLQDASLRQFLLKNLEKEASGSFQWRINLDVISDNYDEILKGLETSRPFEKPTLFIKGERSGYIQEEDMATIREIFPQAQLVSIPGAGHWVHVEAPQEFSRIVLNFLIPRS
jgi:pimeloyl-ACP methyl ester carboxylesterase